MRRAQTMQTHHSYRLVLMLLIASATATAQTSGSIARQDENLAAARAMLQAGRADIIREEILFSDEETAAFWPVYDAYVIDLNTVRDRLVALVARYLGAYENGSITDKMAAELTDDLLSIKTDALKIKRKHLRHFRRVLPERKVARLYQLENKLDAEVDVRLARILPLIDPV